jgi:hypothetical protein
MEIQSHHHIDNLPAVGAASRQGVASAERRRDVDLESSRQLDQALERLPEARPEVVERMRPLVGDPSYPPRETIRSLSHLLAMKMPVE